MILNKKKIKIINEYFLEFINESTKTCILNDYPKYIMIQSDVDFYNDWNYLMYLYESIESRFNLNELRTLGNYVGVTNANEQSTTQDKGNSKREALYIVCFKLLNDLWKKAPFNYTNTEPFDHDDY